MSENLKDKHEKKPEGEQITGHVWDETLCEYNHPLPRWWLISFYATVVFCLGYWILFPTWPLPNSFTKGVYKVEVSEKLVDEDGNYLRDEDGHYITESKKVNWNTRSRLTNELQNSKQALTRQERFAQLMTMDYDEILDDPVMLNFAKQAATVPFADNCATCHGYDATGHVGFYPNLVDDAWLWGGELENIEETITKGRRGNMTAGSLLMNEEEIADVSRYVLTLSKDLNDNPNYVPDEGSRRGEELFYGKGTCYTCHTQLDMNDPTARQPATGNPSMGAPDLTDKVWEIVDVNSYETQEEKLAAIIPQVRDGVNPLTTNREMPAWEDRLTPELIRALAIYVHQLGDSGE